MIQFFKRHLRNFKDEIVRDVLLRQSIKEQTVASLKATETGVADADYFGDGKRLIVSLTTYGKRIYEVFLVIETIFSQTLKANKVVLWLDEDEFTPGNLPLSLKHQENRGLDIRFCRNIYSYKKLVPSLEAFPDDYIVTIDDDILYPFDLLERLVAAYRQDPSYIYFTRGALIKLDDKGNPVPYVQWGKISEACCMQKMCEGSLLAFPTGGAGTLYPPHSLHPDVIRAELFLKLCPKADDLWFKMMSLKKGTASRLVPLYKADDSNLVVLPDNQDTALHWYNNAGGVNRNDAQLKAILDYYKITIKELLEK